jgi:hypothetical protein
MSKADLNRVDKNLETIQGGFQRVLADHGIRSLRVSNFRLSDTKTSTSLLETIAADNKGCWKWVCEMTPTGKVCHEVWDPNC